MMIYIEWLLIIISSPENGNVWMSIDESLMNMLKNRTLDSCPSMCLFEHKYFF